VTADASNRKYCLYLTQVTDKEEIAQIIKKIIFSKSKRGKIKMSMGEFTSSVRGIPGV